MIYELNLLAEKHSGSLYPLQGSPDKIESQYSPNDYKYSILIIITGSIIIVKVFAKGS